MMFLEINSILSSPKQLGCEHNFPVHIWIFHSISHKWNFIHWPIHSLPMTGDGRQRNLCWSEYFIQFWAKNIFVNWHPNIFFSVQIWKFHSIPSKFFCAKLTLHFHIYPYQGWGLRNMTSLYQSACFVIW